MKYIILLLLFMSNIVFAQEEIPEYLKDGTITVTLKDGTKYEYSTNDYKVVKRGVLQKEQTPGVLAKKQEKTQQKKSGARLTAVLAHGPNQLSVQPGYILLQNDYFFGATLQQDIGNDIHFELLGLLNGTIGVGLGFEL